MSQHILSIISPAELLQLKQQSVLVIVDAGSGDPARKKYNEQHLEGARYVDLNTQLAAIKPDASNGGRHPLPSPAQFSETLTSLGISAASHVIIYDDKNGSNAAARFWWMLRSAGHKKVQVLDGGIDAAIKAGFPVSSKMEPPLKAEPYKFENWLLPLTGIQEVEQAAHDENFIVVDVRDTERYNGERETIDLVAGHIPGAINIPFVTNLNTDGSFLPAAELRDKYLKAFHNIEASNIIVHCGSGVTACHTLLALDHAGIEIPKLYVGSWSEWSRTGRPIATKDKNA